MLKIFLLTFIILLIISCNNSKVKEDKSVANSNQFANCIKNLYGPPQTWGPEVKIHECFGESPTCKFSTRETSGDVPVRYQVSKNDGPWEEYSEGSIIRAQKAKARAQSISVTGVTATILVETSCSGCD